MANELHDARDQAKAFAAQHVASLSNEVTHWQDTGVLNGELLRALAEIVAPIAGAHKMQMAESFVNHAARSFAGEAVAGAIDARGQEVDEATAMKGGRWVSADDIEHMAGELLSLATGDPYSPVKMVDAFHTLRAALASREESPVISAEDSLRTRLRWSQEKVEQLEHENRELRERLPGPSFDDLMATAKSSSGDESPASPDAGAGVAQCPNCKGTRAPHALDPAFRGRCECVEGAPASAPEAPEQQGEALTVADELAAFEAWAKRRGNRLDKFGSALGIWSYEDDETQAAFVAWRDRAALASPDLRSKLNAAANYIDTLGGDSKTYRAALAQAAPATGKVGAVDEADRLNGAVAGLQAAVIFLDQMRRAAKSGEDVTGTGAARDAREWLESSARALLDVLSTPAPTVQADKGGV